MKKALLLILKLCVSAGLLALLLSNIPWPAISGIMRQLNLSVFFAATLCYLAANYLSSIRWNLLVSRHMKTSCLFSYYMIGAFFNTCLPGLVGGDAVKAYYLAHDLKQQDDMTAQTQLPHDTPMTIAVASVFMDRYIGLGALLLLGMLAYPFGMPYLAGTNGTWLLPTLFLGYVAGTVLLYLMPINSSMKILSAFAAYAARYRTNYPILLRTFAYSIVVQLFGFLTVFLLARGLGIAIDFLSIMLFLPIIIILTLLPVSISGLGVREGAFVFFFGAIGIEQEKALALSLIWFLSTVTAGLWGFAAYLRIRKTLGAKKEEHAL